MHFLYADLVLPLPLNSLYTYEIPAKMQDSISEGVRVVVPFGKKKYYTGIVVRVYQSEKKANIKSILSTLESHPIVLPQQLRLWEWMSLYYMCPLGDVYKAALPASLKLESKTFVSLKADIQDSISVTANEKIIIDTLSHNSNYSIAAIEKETKIPNVIPAIKSLADKGIVQLSETIQDTYTAKTEATIELFDKFCEDELHLILNSLSKAKKQEALFSFFLAMSEAKETIFKKELLETSGSSAATLNELLKKEILKLRNIEVARIDYGEENLDASYTLNSYQEQAYTEIQDAFAQKDVCLLFGVTASGKTEIYIKLIKEMISKGKQVLYLLPEIALTSQITGRLKRVFGNKLAVYHSKFNANERVDVWSDLLKGESCQVILGARSALFLPFSDLGLIIVDEEHESSYKQQDPSPRYQARDAAIVLANLYKAKTLLGTATPAIETYYNAITGKYGLVRLTQRHQDIELPTINIVNTKELRRTKQMKSVLSPPLIEKMEQALANGEQIILFQNRRGFSSLMECKTCSWTPHCLHCDVSLTYHKQQNLMICHYCGATYSKPSECPECNTDTFDVLGYGTQRIEEEVKEHFPEAAISRMDLDTTRGKQSHERIISDFENKKTNILIGTQMVSKGLDFDSVSIVGVLNADNLLNLPDFRAHEKAFQLMTQVSGRAGRKKKQGEVILQTSHPGHPILSQIRSNDYQAMFETQLDERRLFHYPPFFRLIEIIIRGKNERIVDQTSVYFANILRQSFENRILGPSKPPIARIQSLYIRKIILKIEYNTSVKQVREVLKHHQKAISSHPDFGSVLIHYNADPS